MLSASHCFPEVIYTRVRQYDVSFLNLMDVRILRSKRAWAYRLFADTRSTGGIWNMNWNMKWLHLSLLLLLPLAAMAQAANTIGRAGSSVAAVGSKTYYVPSKTLDFAIEKSPLGLHISPLMTLPVQCTSDGTLFLDMLDPKNVNKHTVVAIKGDESHTYSPLTIPGLHDVFVLSFFPSKSVVGFLVRASTDPPGRLGPGRSPAGIKWSSYHFYVAEFNRDGSYKKSVRIKTPFTLSHLAILPSGEMLVTGYDRPNSEGHLLLLSNEGTVLHQFDLPAFRRPIDENAPFGSAKWDTNMNRLMGNVLFTPYGRDILVWRVGSDDPVVDIAGVGDYREVPLHAPKNTELVYMIPSSDRWVAFFRSKTAPENTPYNLKDYVYAELNPLDGEVTATLKETGRVFHSLECEEDGKYISFERLKRHTVAILESK